MLIARLFACVALCAVALPALAADVGNIAYVSKQDRFAVSGITGPLQTAKLRVSSTSATHRSTWSATASRSTCEFR